MSPGYLKTFECSAYGKAVAFFKKSIFAPDDSVKGSPAILTRLAS